MDLIDRLNDIDGMISGNEIFHVKNKGHWCYNSRESIEYGITGPNLRTTGNPYDLRKIAPYSVYDKFDFEIPIT